MPDVRLTIASRQYTVTCQDGEEAHLARLGSMVDDMARKAAGPSSSLTENRTLLFAALLLADQLADFQGDASVQTNVSKPDDVLDLSSADSDRSAAALEHLAERIEKLASALEEMV
jgi:cell division protein ZapA